MELVHDRKYGLNLVVNHDKAKESETVENHLDYDGDYTSSDFFTIQIRVLFVILDLDIYQNCIKNDKSCVYAAKDPEAP